RKPPGRAAGAASASKESSRRMTHRTTSSIRRHGARLAASAWSLVALGLAIPSGGAHGQAAWTMRVCADPDDFPVSSRTTPGLQNRIAEILADELQARLEFLWTTA